MTRPLTSDDLPAVLELNDAHAAEVNALDAGGAGRARRRRRRGAGRRRRRRLSRRLSDRARRADAVVRPEPRVVPRPPAGVPVHRPRRDRGRGARPRPWAAAVRGAGGRCRARPLCCEVNLVPANPGAWRFTNGSASPRAARRWIRATASACAIFMRGAARCFASGRCLQRDRACPVSSAVLRLLDSLISL